MHSPTYKPHRDDPNNLIDELLCFEKLSEVDNLPDGQAEEAEHWEYA